MSLNLQTYEPNPAGEIRHLFLATEDPRAPGVEYVPRFYIEAKIDFADVRSGLSETCSFGRALEIYAVDGDLLWTEDMAWSVDPDQVKASIPDTARLRSLPEFVHASFLSRMETHFLQYLLRSCHARVFRNFALNVYSAAGESLSDFTGRCLEMFGEPFRRDLDTLREVFDRRIEQIKEKFHVDEQRELEPSQNSSRLKNHLHHMSERIAEVFLHTEFDLESRDDGFQ